MYKVIVYFSDKDIEGEEFTNWDIKAFNSVEEADKYYEHAKSCVWYDWHEIVRVDKDY